MSENKNNNFLIFQNYKQYFEMLSGEQIKELMIMLFEFANEELVEESSDLAVNLVYKTISDNMIIGSKRRIASVENGKKGGRPTTKKSVEVETAEKEVVKKVAKTKVEKDKFGEFQRVLLSAEEHEKIIEIYGPKFEEAIQILDSYLESTGKKYKNHYAVLGKSNWVYKRINEQNYGSTKQQKSNQQDEILDKMKEYTFDSNW